MTDIKTDQAFIPAAGFATRMRPLTDHCPKPLLKLGSKSLLSHILDRLQEVSVKRVVINGHHCLDKIKDYVTQAQNTYQDMEIILSAEDEILETGGGAVLALQHLDKNKPLYMINGDAFWIDRDENTLETLHDKMVTSNYEMVLLVKETTQAHTKQPSGDYNFVQNGIKRSLERVGTHMFAGVRILHPRLLDGYNVEKFSFLDVMDKAESRQKLGGYIHHGEWYHISTPQDLKDANQDLFATVP